MPNLVLTPQQGMARYLNDLRVVHPSDDRVVCTPTLFATVYFENGDQPQVRQQLLDCFNKFDEMFGAYLKGGRVAGGKYSKKTVAGIEAMRNRILMARSEEGVELARSDVVDQYTAPEYVWELFVVGAFGVLGNGGMLSYVKFALPWELAVFPEDLAPYHQYLQFVCQTLPVRAGYGGLMPSLPWDYHRYMLLEYELAKRFSGLEIDSTAHLETDTYRILSVERKPGLPADDGIYRPEDWLRYTYLKPGAEVRSVGYLRSVNWYTILGEPFVQRLGGEAALRAKLDRPDIAVQRWGQCVAVRAGDFPRLGAPEEGLIEPYAFVNRAVRNLRNPEQGSLHTYIPDAESADTAFTRQWVARFDYPGDGPITPFDPQAAVPVASSTEPSLSALPGQPCPKAGLWYAPHLRMREVRMELDELMPGVGERGVTGAVTWYYKGLG
ncbi:hypothetical protein os1_21710 [Comamonadaceae bacterium OS-1]|nr:hypothetical protein os1_21710 [Comamonadaceae bacterium OS-1]